LNFIISFHLSFYGLFQVFFLKVFLLNFVFFCLVLLLIFFIPISYHRLSVYRSSWLGFASSTLYFLKFFFIFDIRLLGDLELYNFFSLIFLRVVSVLYQISDTLVNLIRFVSDYYRFEYYFLALRKFEPTHGIACATYLVFVTISNHKKDRGLSSFKSKFGEQNWIRKSRFDKCLM
jgi:hypothetical protein